MKRGQLISKPAARGFLASAIACLFLLQTLAFVFSANERLAHSSHGAGATIAMAGKICNGAPDGGKAPAPHGGRHHCIACFIGARDAAADAVATFARLIFAPPPRSSAEQARVARDEAAPTPLGWGSSWSSRAPPSYS